MSPTTIAVPLIVLVSHMAVCRSTSSQNRHQLKTYDAASEPLVLPVVYKMESVLAEPGKSRRSNVTLKIHCMSQYIGIPTSTLQNDVGSGVWFEVSSVGSVGEEVNYVLRCGIGLPSIYQIHCGRTTTTYLSLQWSQKRSIVRLITLQSICSDLNQARRQF